LEAIMTEQLILVTGATGDTGRYTIEMLRRRGIATRALVHREDERSERLRALGASVVVGDLLDLDDARAALEGVRSAYFVYPIRPGLIDATAFFAQASREAGVGAIVNMSQISARREAKSNAARNHWISERLFDWSGVPVTHLRPTFFAEWLTYPLARRAIAERGVISFPFGNGRHAPIAAEDQSRLITAILTDPTPHQGKTYPLFGPVELDHHAIADAVGGVLGRKITYAPVTIDDYRKRLEEIPALPPYFVQHIISVALDYQNGIFSGTDDVIERVTGEPPMTVETFIAARKESFAAPAQAANN
jgi:NAD(P)H dehydrogenase (quinone)